MRVALDASMLMLFLRPDSGVPIDPNTSKPVTHPRERIAHLIDTIERGGGSVVIPAPALSEVLVRAGPAAPEIVQIIQKSSALVIAPFAERAAIEAAEMTASAIQQKDKKDGSVDTWAKVKYDRQIVAISKVEGVDTLYSDDLGIANVANRAGINVVKLSDVELPPEAAQSNLFDETP